MKRQISAQSDSFKGSANKRIIQNSISEDKINTRINNTFECKSLIEAKERKINGKQQQSYSESSDGQHLELSNLKRISQSNKCLRTYNNKITPYKRLQQFIRKYSPYPTELLLNLKRDMFSNLVSNQGKLKRKSSDYLPLCKVIHLLSLICDCDPDVLKPYFNEINAKDFNNLMTKFLNSFTAFFDPIQTLNKELHRNAFEDLVKFLSNYQIILQKSSVRKVSSIVYPLSAAVLSCDKSETISQYSVNSVQVIKSLCESSDQNLQYNGFIENLNFKCDFREISLLPTADDIHSFKKPLICRNIVEGKYKSVDHYLDVQFRLLREDLIRPLREGIHEYLENLKENKPHKKPKDIRLYFNVRITGSKFINGLVYSATFNIEDYKHVQWQNSKQLMYGSILCLTSNNFKTFCFATVVGMRDPNLLAKGKFQLQMQIQSMSEEVMNLTSGPLTMAESQTYFESYRNNLLALQRFKSNEFPLKDYIINVSTDIKNLSHLNKNALYDLSHSLSIEKKMKKFVETPNPGNNINNNIRLNQLDQSHIKQSELKKVFVLSDRSWPSASLLGVDDSQYEAIKAALTKQLVIVEGPPGTGKTFVGLKIVEMLLRNKKQWNTKQTSSPILVLCHTNHGLDKFLEGVVPFCEETNGIVRIGGRSESEILEKYCLKNLRQQMQMPRHILKSLEDTENDLKIIQNDLFSLQNDVQMCKLRILGNQLKATIEKMRPNLKMKSLIEQFRSIYDSNFGLALTKWLISKLVLKTIWIHTKESNEKVQFKNFVESDDENLKLLNDYLIQKINGRIQRESNFEFSSDYVMSDEEVMRITDITQMSYNDRWRLYRFWCHIYCQSKQQQLNELNEEYDKKLKYLINLKANTFGNQTEFISCKEELKHIERQLSLAESQIIDSRKKLLGSELRITIEECDKYLNKKEIEKLLDTYNKNFDLALVHWLSDLREVFQEIESSEDQEISNTITESMDQTQSFTSVDSKSEDQLEIDEEEVQNIFDSRIYDNEQCYDNFSYFENMTDITVSEEFIGLGFGLSESLRNRIDKQVMRQLNSDDVMTYHEVMRITNISKLSTKDRWRLYRYWRKNYCWEKNVLIKEAIKLYSEKLKQLQRIRLEQNLYVIRYCDIIGVTITEAAKYRNVIQQIDPLIVVVEEAAQVLESHVVTVLTKSTKHLILIGDHQQLKPNPTVHDLAVNYNLNVSLLERMIKNGLPYHQLKVQYRMRPCFSSLLVPHIYKELRDHESVNDYEDIRGVLKSMFFINHNHAESVSTNFNKTVKNEFEAEFIVRLARYLVLQEYKPSQITILTTYSAQLFLIKQLIKTYDILKEVRAAILDNYQGQECDIILLSFVRSNNEGNIDLLEVPNRVNVALSRARIAMYCIGNFDFLSKKSQLWYEIRKKLIRTGQIGSKLELFCQNHPKNKTVVSKASDFDRVPGGGCLEKCTELLRCGHICGRFCHNNDKEHKTNICDEKCLKTLCELQHECKDKCHFPNKCIPCPVIVNKTIPSCGHQIKLKCSTDPLNSLCTNPCSKILSCGHPCTQICTNDCNAKICSFIVAFDLKCGHRVEVECGNESDVKTKLEDCTEKCGTLLKCSHECQGSCGECHQKRLHISCLEKCERILTCGHSCIDLCGRNCICKLNCYAIKLENFELNSRVRTDLLVKIKRFRIQMTEFKKKLFICDPRIFSTILRELNNLEISFNIESDHSLMKRKFEMIQQIAAFKQLLLELNHILGFRQDFEQIYQLTSSLNDRFDEFLTFIDENYSDNLQQIFDAKQEMNRFLAIAEASKLIIENRFYGQEKQSLIEAFRLSSTLEPFTDENESTFRVLVSSGERHKSMSQLENISEVSPHSLIIKAFVKKSKAHTNVNINIKSIKRYNNTDLRKSFENSFSKDNRMLLWHGTSQANLESIFEEGLKLPASTGNQMFGRGIYFADRVTKSLNYTDCGRNKSGIGTLLLCEVAVGNMLGTTTANHYIELPNGYQSVKGIGKQTPDPNDNYMIENKLLVPLGKTIPSNHFLNSSLDYNEYVIYDPKRVLIRFIVEVERI